MLELGIGDFGQRRLGAIGNAQARFLDHQPVVGAVADGEHVLRRKPELLPRLDQRVALGHGVDDRIADLAAQLPAMNTRRSP